MASTDDSYEFVDILVEYINDSYGDLDASVGASETASLHGVDERNMVLVHRWYRNSFEGVCDLKLPVCTLVCEGTKLKVVEGTWTSSPGEEFDLHDPSSIPNIVQTILERQKYLP